MEGRFGAAPTWSRGASGLALARSWARLHGRGMNYADLRQAVADRLEVVGDQALRERDAAAHLAKLREAAGRLNALVEALPRECDPTLRHYLERQSYVKALAWLEQAGN